MQLSYTLFSSLKPAAAESDELISGLESELCRLNIVQVAKCITRHCYNFISNVSDSNPTWAFFANLAEMIQSQIQTFC